MGNRTLTQEYALYAYKCIEEVKERDEKIQEKYSSRVKKLPAMITHNGLLTTLAFLYSKAQFKNEKNEKTKTNEKNKKGEENENAPNAEALLLSQIIFLLNKESLDKNDKENENKVDKSEISSFIKKLAEMDFQNLMLYSRKALTLAQWLKRLAEGEFEDATNE